MGDYVFDWDTMEVEISYNFIFFQEYYFENFE
jgi:hypothetical protein